MYAGTAIGEIRVGQKQPSCFECTRGFEESRPQKIVVEFLTLGLDLFLDFQKSTKGRFDTIFDNHVAFSLGI